MQNNKSKKFNLFFAATAMSIGFIAPTFADTCPEKSKNGKIFFEARWIANGAGSKKKNYIECIYEINKEDYEFETETHNKYEYLPQTNLKIWEFDKEQTMAVCRSNDSLSYQDNAKNCSFVVKN